MFYETATVHARPLATATAAVTVLDREAIAALDVATVAELIRFIPGLDVTSGGPRGAVATAQIRGGDPNFTAVLLDGVPLNDSTDQFGGAVNLNSLPTAQIERIEIVRGPLSSFFGSTGLAGAINIITRRGQSSQPAFGFGVAGGNASVVQADASLSQGDESQDYFVGVAWEQEHERVAEDSFEQLGVQGSYRSELGERAEVRLSGRITTWEAEDYPDASGGPVFGTGETRVSDHEEGSLALEWGLGQPDRRHKLMAAVYHHELDRDSPGVPPVVPPSMEQTVYTNAKLGWAFPLVVHRRMRLSVGAQLAEERGRNESILSVAPGFDIDGSYTIDRTTAGAFVELLAERDRLVLELGLRVDSPEGFDTEPSARAGVSYRLPGDRTRLRATAGRAFKLPSFFALASPDQLGGNADLDPEITLGGDVGVEHAFGASGLSTRLNLFYYRFEDLIDFSFAPPPDFGLFNSSEVESRGAELGLGWRDGDRVTAEMNLTRQEVENVETGQPLRNRPEWIAGARLSWRIAERVRWELDGQSVSERIDQQIPVQARDRVSGYDVYGSALVYDLTPGWTLHGRIDNLTDEDYETMIGFPGPGRSFRVGLRHRSR